MSWFGVLPTRHCLRFEGWCATKHRPIGDSSFWCSRFQPWFLGTGNLWRNSWKKFMTALGSANAGYPCKKIRCTNDGCVGLQPMIHQRCHETRLCRRRCHQHRCSLTAISWAVSRQPGILLSWSPCRVQDWLSNSQHAQHTRLCFHFVWLHLIRWSYCIQCIWVKSTIEFPWVSVLFI